MISRRFYQCFVILIKLFAHVEKVASRVAYYITVFIIYIILYYTCIQGEFFNRKPGNVLSGYCRVAHGFVNLLLNKQIVIK